MEVGVWFENSLTQVLVLKAARANVAGEEIIYSHPLLLLLHLYLKLMKAKVKYEEVVI